MFLYFSDDYPSFFVEKRALCDPSLFLCSQETFIRDRLVSSISYLCFRISRLISHCCLEKQFALSRDSRKIVTTDTNNEIEMLYYLTVNSRYSGFQYSLTIYSIGNIINNMMEKNVCVCVCVCVLCLDVHSSIIMTIH